MFSQSGLKRQVTISWAGMLSDEADKGYCIRSDRVPPWQPPAIRGNSLRYGAGAHLHGDV